MGRCLVIDVDIFNTVIRNIFKNTLAKRLQEEWDKSDLSMLTPEERTQATDLWEACQKSIIDQIFPTPIPDGHYQCEHCHGVFAQGWSEEEARAERAANGWADVECAIVCDDCHQKISRYYDTLLEAVPQEQGQ